MNHTAPRTDRAEIVRALRLILAPDQVTELRALDATTADDRRPHVESGYFDHAHIEHLAEAVGTIRMAKGIYIVVNPVNPALLARACNRMKAAGRTTLTGDKDIVSRRWLLVDIDPQRPVDISSSDAEHDAALAMASRIRVDLSAAGWPEPIQADSGNGAHLLYRIDQPAEDDGLVKRCLESLAAKYDTDSLKVDQIVFNPARIWKLFGTLACKGDHTPDRPHRMSRIIHAPEAIDVVGVELLETLAGQSSAAAEPKATTSSTPTNGRFDLENWIKSHGLDLRGPEPWQGGRRWVFSVCPWNSDHTNGSAFLVQHASGAIAAGCHHDGCKGRGWHDLRDAVEPGWRERRGQHAANGHPAGPPPWPALIPFDDRGLPEYPERFLPATLREWVLAESHATQTPKDLAALLALSVVSACIARRVVVEARPGWREPTNLFTAVLLEPGNRKSAVFADALKPLREVEAELIAAARPFVARAQSERRRAETKLKKLEKIAAETGDLDACREAGDLAAAMAEQPEPVLPRLLADDATAEKLGAMMAQQGGRIFSASPEGNVFDLMAGQYSKNGAPHFDVYLKGHSGDTLRTDRIGRESVFVERPALTCAYTVQPSVIAGLADQPAFRGRGLLARFLYASPPSPIGRRQIAPAPVPEGVANNYRALIRTLAAVEGERVLELLPSAGAALRDWEAEIESMLADDGAMEHMRDWGGKLAGATLRLAGVLHCAEQGPGGKIGRETIESAIGVGRYLIPHADATLAVMSAAGKPVDDAQWVLGWIVRHGKTEFSKTEAQQHGKRRFPRADDIDPALRELTRRAYIRLRPAEVDGPGRPPSPIYDVSPFVFSDPEKRSRYSVNSVCEPKNGSLQNIQSAFEQNENEIDHANRALAEAAEPDEEVTWAA